MKKQLFLCFLVLIFFETTPFAQTLPYNVLATYAGSEYIRNGPSTSGTILTSVSNSQQLVAYGISSGWYQVYIPDHFGFNFGYCIGGSGAVVPYPCGGYVTIQNTLTLGLNIRVSPGTSSSTVLIAGNSAKGWDGQKFACTGTAPVVISGSTWRQIYLTDNCDHLLGWVSDAAGSGFSYYVYTPPASLPSVPSGLFAAASSCSSIALSWSGSSSATSYSIYDCSGIFITNVSGTSYIASGLSALTTYGYKIRGVNFCDSSTFTTCQNATTPCCGTTPAIPSGLTATPVSCTSVMLNWSTSSSATSYSIYDCSGTFITNVSSTSYLASSLIPLTSYSYKIRAVNSCDSSAFTTCQSISTPCCGTTPTVPTAFTAVSTSCSSVALNWAASSSATSYSIYDCSGTFITNVPTTSYIVSALSSMTTYSYKIRAVNLCDSSIFTACQVTTTPCCSATPAPPTGLTTTPVSCSSISLNWVASGTATSYSIYDCSGIFITNVSATSYTASGLSSSTTYSYKIRAVNACDSSTFTSCQSSTTPTCMTTPAVPLGFTAVATTCSSISLSWMASASATSYSIYNCSGVFITNIPGLSYVVTALAPSTMYTYKVRAVNSFDSSAFTLCQSATTPICPTTPGVPTGFTASPATCHSIFMSWSPSTAATSYSIYDCTGSFIANVSGVSYSAIGLAPTTTYNYKIRAVNASDSSSFTTCQTATTPTCPTSSSPDLTIISPSISNSSVCVLKPENITYTIQNAGTVPATSSITSFFLSSDMTYNPGIDVRLNHDAIPSIAATGNITHSVSVTVPFGVPLGTWYILLVADSANSVIESDETNNISFVSINVVACSLEVNQMEHADEITVYPNPTRDKINILTNASIQSGTIAIYNTIGQKIYVRDLDRSHTYSFDLASYPSGFYFIRVTSGETNYTKTIDLIK